MRQLVGPACATANRVPESHDLAAAARELEPGVRLLKLNSQDQPEVAARLQMSGIPTLVLFNDGHEVARQAGALAARQIVAWTNQALARAAA